MALYVTFVMIILLNLIIARMSSTHEKINDKSFEQWSMVMAKNVQDCLLINEKVRKYILVDEVFLSTCLLLLQISSLSILAAPSSLPSLPPSCLYLSHSFSFSPSLPLTLYLSMHQSISLSISLTLSLSLALTHSLTLSLLLN